MASRADVRRVAWAGVLALLMTQAAHAAEPVEPVAAPLEQVERTVTDMRADPTLNGFHLERQLRWKHKDGDDAKRDPKSPHWLRQLAGWLGDASRALVWVLGAIAVALVALFALRWARVRADALRVGAALRPSHVNELDIRPESLPDDIAASALALCRRGEHRAALSLLYRGALSRLVHDHGVAIGAASTEGECVALAQRSLPAAASAYFARLVAAWQTEVYAGRAADPAQIAALCAEFDARLGGRSAGPRLQEATA